MITIDDFKKLDLRVGEVLNAEEISNTDKLYRLEVDIGGKQIQLVAGIRKYYTKNEIIGKKIIVLVNLQPINIRGITSEGMLLAAVDESNDNVSLLTVDRDIKVGSRVA